ncbi:MAG: hypothetical protein D6701_15430 [Gemmatimonadetes bacterium]|nr:MAG: hypothetical protein D6701_15430 [Gemmatimonadota bacterium]
MGRDAVLVNGPSAHHVVLDHLSLEWAEDKALVIFGGATDVTVQWSILAETLYCANHTKTVDPARFDTFGPCPTGGAPHSRAVTISTTPNGGTPPDRISMHHNLFAHNNKRHPNVVSQTLVDFVNNVVYDLGDLGANLGLKPGNPGPVRLNYVRNWVAAGPGTVTGVHMVSAPQNTAEGALQVWLEGNQIEGPIEAVPDFFATRGYLAGERHAAPPITESMPVAARDAVLQGAGQTLPVRDAVDARIAGEVLSGAGRFVDDPSQVGGWPDPAAGPPPADADGDGMPDAWEAQHGLDPAAAADAVDDPDRDGYTNVEEFLNGTDPTRRNG